MNRISFASILLVCSIVMSCDKLTPIYDTDIRVLFNPLRIYEVDADKAALELTTPSKLVEGERLYSLHLKGDIVNSELAGLESSVKDYEGSNIGNTTSAQKAYATTIYPRVRDVKKAWVTEHNADVPAYFCYMFINGIPTITANMDCFGLPAGSDLSSCFYLKQSGLVKNGNGFSVKMAGEGNISFSDYFCHDAMIPIYIHLYSDELDDDISETEITITLPVKVENFWTYALLFETWGKAINLEYSDKVFSLTIPVSK